MPAIHLLISALCVHVAYSYYLFLLTFPICIIPSFFFMCLTFSFISYVPEYGPAPFPGRRSLEATEPGFSLFCVDVRCIFS